MDPSWPDLVEPIQKINDRLAVVWGAVNHLKSVKDNPELRSAIEEVQVLIPPFDFSLSFQSLGEHFLCFIRRLSLYVKRKMGGKPNFFCFVSLLV